MSIPTTDPETAGPGAEGPPVPEPVPELEALRRERDELCAERDRIRNELAALRRGSRVRSLAEVLSIPFSSSNKATSAASNSFP